ncbi:MAG: hypothetical protein FWF83_01490 [Clostridiales bacterium]|nr:hypothetical protein [Clostridiales bacterium]
MKNDSALKLSVMGLLIAIGIIIPMFSPIKIVLEPASFTLASHVAIFIAMYISPVMAVAVAVGTTAGFFLGGFPLVIVVRAASHVVFAFVGAYYLQKAGGASFSAVKLRVFSVIVALVHGFFEALVVSVFFYDGNMSQAYYQRGFLTSVVLLVGIGTVVHSMVDFEIANVVVLALRRQRAFQKLV